MDYGCAVTQPRSEGTNRELSTYVWIRNGAAESGMAARGKLLEVKSETALSVWDTARLNFDRCQSPGSGPYPFCPTDYPFR